MSDRYIDNGDNTITDTKTGLVWSKQTIAEDVNHENAQKAVEELGEGWRLPTIHELFSITDHSRHDPAIDTEVFPDTKIDWYWTDTPCAWNRSARWVVTFYYGFVIVIHGDGNACVRAVRASQ